MRRCVALFLMSLAVPLTAARAQQPGEDPIAQQVFPPELVMKHGQEIGLDEKQRATIKELIQGSQSKFLDVQWDLQAESEKMVGLLQATPVNEAAVLAQADKVMGLEREVKKTHLSLLIRIKNLLTEAQQGKLMEIRKRALR